MVTEYFDETIDIFKRDNSILRKTLIGFGMFIFSFLIIPMIFYQGYLMKILEETENGFPEVFPEWTDFKQLGKYGLIAFVITLAAQIPFFSFIIPIALDLHVAIIIGTAIFSFIYILTVGYLSFAVLAIIFRDSFEALSIERVKTSLFSIDYFIGWTLITVIGTVVGLLMSLINLLTLGFGSILILPLFVPINFVTSLIMGVTVSKAEGLKNIQYTDSS